MKIFSKYIKYESWNELGLRGFWIRICGYGISISNHPLIFSERNGNTKYIMLGKYKIKYLPKLK